MHQCNGLDYAFLTKAYKNTAYINSFFFLEKENNFDCVEHIERCLKKSIEKEYLFQAVLSQPISEDFLPCFFRSNKKININDHLIVKKINYTKENFNEYLQTIYSKPMDLTKPLWEVHLLELTDEKTVAFVIRIHHALGDGSVVNRMIKSATKENFKRRSTNIKNNKLFNSYLIPKINLRWAYAEAKAKFSLKKNKLNRNFSKVIFSKKQDKKLYENKRITFKCLDYKLFKVIMEKNKCTFQSVMLYLYSISYKEISGKKDFTSFAAVPNRLKGPKYGSYVYAYLCDLFLDRDASLEDFDQSLEAEKKYFYQKKYFNKVNALLRYPRKDILQKGWDYLMPVMNGTVISNTPHHSDVIRIGKNKIESYWAVPVYPEINESLGISLNTHRSNNQVNITCLSYPDILKYSDKFLDIFEYNLVKLSLHAQSQ